jgi:hypothetical protein
MAGSFPTTVLLFFVVLSVAACTAERYGNGIYVAFDLHRFDMLQALHSPLPDPAQDRRLGRRNLMPAPLAMVEPALVAPQRGLRWRVPQILWAERQ